MNELLSLLCFPQRWENGTLYFNIVILPRNLNPLSPWQNNIPAFADGNIVFTANLITSLDGLPLTSSPKMAMAPNMIAPATDTRSVWEALKLQFEQSEQILVRDADDSIPGNGRAPQPGSMKPLYKYLPVSYRSAFNFIKSRTKYAVTGDEYRCSIQNQSENQDEATDSTSMTWGQLVAFSLRNTMLAKKLGLIYEASIDLGDQQESLDGGGWLYITLDPSGDFAGISKKIYAARIPSLKDVDKRPLFSVNQFRVNDDPVNINSAGYDEIIRESILYDDGFAKIVHANQPINQDPTLETDFSNPPMMDVGMRLGWEDEQITIWYNRQMSQTEEMTNLRVDAPMGVFGYRIDVREDGESIWQSQNSITNTAAMTLNNGNIEIVPVNTVYEPGTEVTPAAHGNVKADGLWAPMYYTSWIGKSLATADRDAVEIYRLKNDAVVVQNDKTGQLVPKKTYSPNIQNPSQHLSLRYGKSYEFRVRLMDISGGGPSQKDPSPKGGENPIGKHHFKRYVGAGAMQIDEMLDFYNTRKHPEDELLKDYSVLENVIGDELLLHIRRPLLSYPAVVFTDKYDDPIQLMKNFIESYQDAGDQKALEVGLPDPDVDQFRVRVEARSLEMDNAASITGKEPYIKLYDKLFTLPTGGPYDGVFPLKIVYQDFTDVDLSKTFTAMEGLADDILLLPTARQLRITFTSVVSVAQEDGQIYADPSVLFGKSTQLTSFKPSLSEENLLSLEADNVQAFYLQPDNATHLNLKKMLDAESIFLNAYDPQTPIELKRLADRLDIVANKLTLQGETGQRVQFGCSREIRHSLAPDSSSITLSSLHDLFHHWIIALDFNIERDWAWSGLKVDSFSVYRSWKVPATGKERLREKVGIIQISHTANINALFNAERHKTRVLFLDAMDPKLTVVDFPNEFTLTYEVEVHFKEGFSNASSIYALNEMALPITIIPSQMPKLVSAGIALAPYKADMEKYRFTEQRAKYLWLEFDEPLKDPQTSYQVRVLAGASDPLLSKITVEKLNAIIPDEPIQLDAEPIRHIIAGMANDHAGVKAMQPMIAEELKNPEKAKIFMVPLPKGLHANSDELFGFFTYEIRVGYKPEIWSTAQARFGRPLRANGVQHPAPNLFCTASIKDLFSFSPAHLIDSEHHLLNEMMVKDILGYKAMDTSNHLKNSTEYKALYKEFENLGTMEHKIKVWRDRVPKMVRNKSKKVILVSAPYAMAVENGKNVTASPPQTSLWYLLYTQVKQADGKSYRNVLIDSGMLSVSKKRTDEKGAYHSDERSYGLARIVLGDIQDRLQLMGLPRDNGLSVLVAEMFPMHNSWSFEFSKGDIHSENIHGEDLSSISSGINYENVNVEQDKWGNPLIDDLGKHRIYRTSPLVPIDLGCCEEC